MKCYDGDALVKLQSIRKQYENLIMKNNEKLSDYISRVTVVTNEMKSCGKTLSEQVIIKKVLRLLTPQFDYIVVAIKHSKDNSTMRIEELHGSLEALELCLTERNSERESRQTLKASFVKKNQKQTSLESNKNYGGGAQKSELSNSQEKKHKNVHKGNEKFGKRKVQCYSCNKFGHFTADY